MSEEISEEAWPTIYRRWPPSPPPPRGTRSAGRRVVLSARRADRGIAAARVHLVARRGTPAGRFPAAQGDTVYSPLLAGHGTAPEDLRGTTWRDSGGLGRGGGEVLRDAHGKRIALVGLSLGGSISLYLVARQPQAYLGLVTTNSPVFIPTIFQPALRWPGSGPLPFFDKAVSDVAAERRSAIR